MKLASRNYKSNSRSDGFLSRRYDDDYDDDEVCVIEKMYTN